MLLSGTRDLLLSNTVRVHRKLRQAGVESVLEVFEGQPHGAWYRDASVPESKDAFDGPSMTENLAAVYAVLGDADNAINILDGLLARPSYVTVEMLKLNPVWDRIRSNPRFAELLTKHSAKA